MLTDIDCKNAICPPEKKRLRLADGGNLYLEVTPTGVKRWFWKFQKDNKERRLAVLGNYPQVSLKKARSARDAAKLEKDTQKPSNSILFEGFLLKSTGFLVGGV